MRLSILAVFLSTVPVAFCQSAAPAPVNPLQHWFNTPGTPLSQPGSDSTNPSQNWQITGLQPRQIIDLPRLVTVPHMDNPPMDSKMIVHPPKSNLGEQPPGTLVAQNLYPGLQFLPIEEPKRMAQPIPTAWPKLKVQPIPIDWTELTVRHVESFAPSTPSGK